LNGDDRLNFDDIKQKLKKIDSEIFIYLLKNNLSIEQLALLYSKLLECRDRFLGISFKDAEIDEV